MPREGRTQVQHRVVMLDQGEEVSAIGDTGVFFCYRCGDDQQLDIAQRNSLNRVLVLQKTREKEVVSQGDVKLVGVESVG